MKTLLIANANTIWTTEYISNVLIKANLDIYIVAFEPLEEQYDLFYAENGIHVLDLCKNGHPNKIEKLLQLTKLIKKECKKEKFDFFDIVGIPNSIQATFLYFLIKKYGKDCICTFLGSDLFRIDANKRVKRLMETTTYIVLSTDVMQDEFRQKYGNNYDEKILDYKSGTPSLGEIKLLKENSSKNDCKMHFDFPRNKITIALGYNGNKEQQHLKVIEALSNLDEDIKNKIHLVLHFGYGNDDEKYKAEILTVLNREEFSYSLIEKFMDKAEISLLRMGTDIFIHAQTSDGLSGSIREIIYAEGILINPSWIEYDEFRKNGITYLEYDDFSELVMLIKRIINQDIVIDLKGNANIVYELYSWEKVSIQWMEIYDKGKN